MLWKSEYKTTVVTDLHLDGFKLAPFAGGVAPAFPMVILCLNSPSVLREGELWRRLLDESLSSRIPVVFGLWNWNEKDLAQADDLFPPSQSGRLFKMELTLTAEIKRCLCILAASDSECAVAFEGPATEDAYDQLADAVNRIKKA